ncbi:MAG: S8 family serine peptidase [Planctomycetes bacterium]|nr:S8 family serine peptidase [Planctomycetota bacterium]
MTHRTVSLLPQLALGLFVILSACSPAWATELSPNTLSRDSYWVFFRDKAIQNDAEYQQGIAAVRAGYSPAAIERREMRGSTAEVFGYSDLPVANTYLTSVQQSGASINYASSWLNAVSIKTDASQLAAIAALPFVDHVQPVARFGIPSITNAAPATAAPSAGQTFYGNAEAQSAQIGIQAVHNLGITGAGVTIGVLDTGFIRNHEAFNQPGHVLQVAGEYDFINNDGNTADGVPSGSQINHGTYILGVMGAYKPNTLVGAAYGSSFLLAKTEVVPTETQIEETYWVAGLQWLEANGADVVTSSLGYIDWYTQTQLNGHIAVTSVAAHTATLAGLPIVNAAGNQGHDGNPTTSSLIAPADAELVITVGAVNSAGVLAGFSSSGPTADGRLKPEVLAQGVGTATVSPGSISGYTNVDGTSLSTPLVASTIALMLDANPNLTVPQIRQILFSTASRANNPDTAFYLEGYGIINAYQAVLEAQELAVPEPATIWLAAAGMFGLVLLARKYPSRSAR